MATTINAGRVRFVSRGTYNNSTQYYLFDLVDYNGSSYIAKENTVGNLPTNNQYWQLIAEKGNTGNDGQQGPIGLTGNGIASITKTSTSGLVDTYTITYTNGNTTTFTVTNGEDANTTEITNLKNENAYLQNVVKQAFTEATASGTELTIDNTIEARMEMKLNGNTSQNGEPTPATPQEIHCVKGNNVVKVTNQNLFDESEEYPINLGSLELCKIDDYQDYIYKQEDKWYKHKVIDKIVLNGDMSWIFFDNKKEIGIKSNSVIQISNALILVTDSTKNETPLFSSHFLKGTQTIVIKGYNFIGFSKWRNDIYLYLPNVYDSINTAKNWLNTNKPIVYYAISTPIEEEIIDTTLITQLDEISQALSKKGTTIISQNNDDLPFNLDVIALTK